MKPTDGCAVTQNDAAPKHEALGVHAVEVVLLPRMTLHQNSRLQKEVFMTLCCYPE